MSAVRAHRLIAFGALVVALTVIVMAAGLGAAMTPFGLVFVPAISALVVAGLADGVAGIRRLFGRIARWRVAPIWYVAALGVPLAMWLVIDLVGVAMGTPVSALFQGSSRRCRWSVWSYCCPD